MTTFLIPRNATPDDIERARPPGAGDSRCHSEPLQSPWVLDLTAANTLSAQLPEPTNSARQLRGLVAAFVNPLVYDFSHGYTSHTNADEFRADVMNSVRRYAAEMDLDAGPAEMEARRLLKATV